MRCIQFHFYDCTVNERLWNVRWIVTVDYTVYLSSKLMLKALWSFKVLRLNYKVCSSLSNVEHNIAEKLSAYNVCNFTVNYVK